MLPAQMRLEVVCAVRSLIVLDRLNVCLSTKRKTKLAGHGRYFFGLGISRIHDQTITREPCIFHMEVRHVGQIVCVRLVPSVLFWKDVDFWLVTRTVLTFVVRLVEVGSNGVLDRAVRACTCLLDQYVFDHRDGDSETSLESFTDS